MLDLAAANDIIIKSGAWYSYKGERIGQGRENAKNYLAENPAVFDEVEQAVREKCLAKEDDDPGQAQTVKAGSDEE